MRILAAALNTPLWPLTASGIAFVALCLAWVSEIFWGLAPCPLCYTQRYIYWTGIVVGLTSFVAGHILNHHLFRIGCALLVIVFGVGVYYAAYHAGVEWEVFAPPGGCSGDGADLRFDGGLSLDTPLKLTDCIAAPFRVLGLSMAGWNILAYAGLLALSLFAAMSPSRDAQ